VANVRDDDDEALPWLEPADSIDDDDDDRRGFPLRGMVVASAVVVATVAVLWFVADRFSADRVPVAVTDEVPLIQAPEGPYKERPADPGGIDVDTGSLTHAVAEGADPAGQLALDALPEEPVPVTAPPPAAAAVRKAEVPAPKAAPPAPAAEVKRPPTPQPKIPVAAEPLPQPAPPRVEAPRPAPGSVAVQLGAFNSAATADAVWSKLAAKGVLAGLTKSVQPVETGGRTLYRLRASGAADGAAVCAKVQAAGEQCAVVR
jgi:cell division septation protein DedD